jgi:hypothetical protein
MARALPQLDMLSQERPRNAAMPDLVTSVGVV